MKKHLIASAAILSLLAFRPAIADSARAESVMNQTGGYEETLAFYLHPARLEWSASPPSELGEHPAVLVSRNSLERGYDYTTKFYPHPARLEWIGENPLRLASEEPRG